MTNVMARVIRALARFFHGDMWSLFKAHHPVEIPLSAETTATIARLKSRYSLEVVLPAEPIFVGLEHGQYLTSIEGRPATSEEADSYLPLFAEEFGLYPPLLVRRTRLTRVVLCGELFRSQRPAPGIGRLGGPFLVDCQPLSFEHVPCGGVPDGEHGVLYLSVTAERDDEDHVRKLIHHELYHCVQRRQFGGFGDRRWNSLNSPDFEYGPGGLAVNHGADQSFWVMPAEEWGSGFLNQYSMSASEEDQAEIFAHLLTEPARVEARLGADDILRKKVERLKGTLESFCPAINESFWCRVEESRWPYGL